MGKAIRLFLLLLLTTNLVWAQKDQKPNAAQPNIVLIFADDMGYKDCGFTGSDFFETPNIDALSKRGMMFSNAYAGAGNCAPSRACLLSGQYTPRHGVYAVGSTTRGPVEQMRVVPVPNKEELAGRFTTMAEGLKQAGYVTGLFGKWHLGTDAETSPIAQGFDTYFDSRQNNPNKKRDEPTDPKGIFSLTDKAQSFMTTNKDKPFFVYLAHHAIHSNLEARPASIEKFRKKGADGKKALYAGCVYDLDASVGQLLAHLDKLGLSENTLVIFTSDNGATQQSSQEPLRGNKGGYYEGGIREPFIAYWPGAIRPGSTNPTPIINLDLYPTFLAVAGVKKLPSMLDGESLLPLFRGAATGTKRSTIFWHFPGYLDVPVIRGRDSVFRSRPVTVMRKGNWKIHLYHEEWLLDGGRSKIDKSNAVELYDLATDEGERTNLASTNKPKRDELLTDLVNWLNKTKAPMPVPIDATHKPIPGTAGGEN